jgi:hypothetical protein
MVPSVLDIQFYWREHEIKSNSKTYSENEDKDEKDA